MSFRVVFLIGEDNEATRHSISAVCALQGIEPAGVLLDTHKPGLSQRFRNLRRNVTREGLGYVGRRFTQATLANLEAHAVNAFVDPRQTDELLRQAFPERCWSIEELARKHGMPVVRAGNLNQPEAVAALRELKACLGIVLGTRILKPCIFSAPRLGSINLHKGFLPNYRGLPPGFWELYAGETRAGATAHFVDAGLDTGDIIAEDTIPISPLETPETLRVKLNWLGSEVLARAVMSLSAGTAQRSPQPKAKGRANSKPSEAQQNQLALRLPHWRRKNPLFEIAKHLLYFTFYYSGLLALKRAMRSPHRVAILLYHRVNNWSIDPLTTSERRFAEHLLFLKQRYPVISTQNLLDALDSNQLPAHASIIHFDDCYCDVATAAGPLLRAAHLCGTAFISSGFIDTDRVFDHDRRKYPHRYPNLTSEDIRNWHSSGLEVAAHTVNHVDLGSIPLEDAHHEVFDSGHHLSHLLQKPITRFSFPFGGKINIRPEVTAQVQEAGYQAMFSAHGGFVRAGCNRFDIPRLGAHEQSPLYLLMELEGLALAQWKHWFASLR